MKIDRLKSSKPFHFMDVFIYVFLVVIIFLLFLFFIIIPTKKNDESLGFIVELNGKIIITYSYTLGELTIDDSISEFVQKNETDNGFILTLYNTKDKKEYNVLSVDNTEKSVKMIESTCRSKQCTYLHEIKNSGIIYCAPRNLKISPIGGSGFIPPIAG